MQLSLVIRSRAYISSWSNFTLICKYYGCHIENVSDNILSILFYVIQLWWCIPLSHLLIFHPQISNANIVKIIYNYQRFIQPQSIGMVYASSEIVNNAFINSHHSLHLNCLKKIQVLLILAIFFCVHFSVSVKIIKLCQNASHSIALLSIFTIDVRFLYISEQYSIVFIGLNEKMKI